MAVVTFSDSECATVLGGAIAPPKTYESNDVHHDFLQFGKQHSKYKQNRRQKVVNRGALRLCGVALRSFVQGWA